MMKPHEIVELCEESGMPHADAVNAVGHYLESIAMGVYDFGADAGRVDSILQKAGQ